MADDDPSRQDETPPPPPPPPAPSQAGIAPGGALRPADIGIRIVARLLDEILLLIANLLIVSPLFSSWRDPEGVGAPLGLAGTGTAFAAGLVALTISLGYYAGLESTWGRTVGKHLLGLRTVGPAGDRPTPGEALRRNAWIAVGVVPVVGVALQLAAAVTIIVTVSRSRTDQGVHDQLAGGTSVLRV